MSFSVFDKCFLMLDYHQFGSFPTWKWISNRQQQEQAMLPNYGKNYDVGKESSLSLYIMARHKMDPSIWPKQIINVWCFLSHLFGWYFSIIVVDAWELPVFKGVRNAAFIPVTMRVNARFGLRIELEFVFCCPFFGPALFSASFARLNSG